MLTGAKTRHIQSKQHAKHPSAEGKSVPVLSVQQEEQGLEEMIGLVDLSAEVRYEFSSFLRQPDSDEEEMPPKKPQSRGE